MRNRLLVVMSIFTLSTGFAQSHAAEGGAPITSQTVGLTYRAEAGLQGTSGCVTTSLYVVADINLLAGQTYRPASRFTDAGIFLDEIDCDGTLIRSWGTESGVAVITRAQDTFHAVGQVTVLECSATGVCASRDVPFDLTWVLDHPLSEPLTVGTTNDIHVSGFVASQLGKTVPAALSGTIDNGAVDPLTVSFAQVGFNVSTTLVHAPRPAP